MKTAGSSTSTGKCVLDRNIRIENKKLRKFVARSSRAPPGEVQDL